MVAADLFADADLARHCPVTRIERYPEGFVEWLAATECDAWMYTGALENHPELVDRLAEVRPLVGNGGAALRAVRDPMKLQAALAAAGVPFAETRTSAEGLPLDGSWLCKTYRGASGSGVWALDGAAALARAERERAVFQRLIVGEPASQVFVLAEHGQLIFAMTRQLLGQGERQWQYAGSIASRALMTTRAELMVQLAACANVLATEFSAPRNRGR